MAGKAYYLGDFFAAAGAYQVNYSIINYYWELKEVRDEYESATSEIKEKYPGFASVVTEKRILGTRP